MNFNERIVFSDDRLHRYFLERIFQEGSRTLNFCMLNPSTADEIQNDPTVRRCIGYAQDWGYDRLIVTNIFAYRSTNPKGLREIENPAGDENNYYIEEAAKESEQVICAWGNHGEYLDRGSEVSELLKPYSPHHLGLTKCGQPKHPLYLAKKLLPIKWALI